MTTTATAAPAFDALDFEIPEELQERSRTWVGELIFAGAQMPPEKRAAAISANGRMVRPEFHIVIDPRSFKYNSDRSKGFEDDYEHGWYALTDSNGEPAKAGSNLDLLKKAFAKLGFVITNRQQAEALVGLVFEWETRKITPKRNVKDDVTGEWSEVEGKPYYVILPVKLVETDWQPTGSVQVIDRPRVAGGGSAPNAASVDPNAAAALPILAEVLNGKTEKEYFKALTDSKKVDILKPPYITEASANPHALTMRMISSTLMRQDGDTLVKVGS